MLHQYVRSSVRLTMSVKAFQLDQQDEISGFRDRFKLARDIIYLDGNSLGALPLTTIKRLDQVINQEWGSGLIGSWNDAGWINLPQRLGDKLGPLIGAEPGEVIVTDSVSVNIFKILAGALQIQKGKRKVILSEMGNFPTDLYMIQGIQSLGLAQSKVVETDKLFEALDDSIAVLLLSHVHYKNSTIHDLTGLTSAAQNAGALVLWDLSHSCGAMPIDLNLANVDFAVGCGYKYLCGGPGAPAYCYVAERHQKEFRQPLSGWMGHNQPFGFHDEYVPASGVNRMLCGTPPILSMAALEEGIDIISEIGIDRLYKKSCALSEFFLDCLVASKIEIEIISPKNVRARGSHISIRHENAYAVSRALEKRGVIGDFRSPDILRLGFAPAYLTFADVEKASRTLAEIIDTCAWRDPEFQQMRSVT